VPGALGKAQFALGKGFAECCPRQKALGKKRVGKDVFAECLEPKKNPKKIGIFTQKKWIFFNWWRPPPVSAHPSPAFFA